MAYALRRPHVLALFLGLVGPVAHAAKCPELYSAASKAWQRSDEWYLRQGKLFSSPGRIKALFDRKGLTADDFGPVIDSIAKMDDRARGEAVGRLLHADPDDVRKFGVDARRRLLEGDALDGRAASKIAPPVKFTDLERSLGNNFREDPKVFASLDKSLDEAIERHSREGLWAGDNTSQYKPKVTASVTEKSKKIFEDGLLTLDPGMRGRVIQKMIAGPGETATKIFEQFVYITDRGPIAYLEKGKPISREALGRLQAKLQSLISKPDEIARFEYLKDRRLFDPRSVEARTTVTDYLASALADPEHLSRSGNHVDDALEMMLELPSLTPEQIALVRDAGQSKAASYGYGPGVTADLILFKAGLPPTGGGSYRALEEQLAKDPYPLIGNHLIDALANDALSKAKPKQRQQIMKAILSARPSEEFSKLKASLVEGHPESLEQIWPEVDKFPHLAAFAAASDAPLRSHADLDIWLERMKFNSRWDSYYDAQHEFQEFVEYTDPSGRRIKLMNLKKFSFDKTRETFTPAEIKALREKLLAPPDGQELVIDMHAG